MPIGALGRGWSKEVGLSTAIECRLVDCGPGFEIVRDQPQNGTNTATYWVLHDADIRIPKRTRLIVTPKSLCRNSDGETAKVSLRCPPPGRGVGCQEALYEEIRGRPLLFGLQSFQLVVKT